MADQERMGETWRGESGCDAERRGGLGEACQGMVWSGEAGTGMADMVWLGGAIRGV